MNSKNIITVIIIIAASALIVGIFIYFGGANSDISSGLQVEPIAGSGVEGLSQELLSALSSLKDLKLDATFFRDPALVSLIDYSKDLRDEPVGRENPFLPVSAGSGNIATPNATNTPAR